MPASFLRGMLDSAPGLVGGDLLEHVLIGRLHKIPFFPEEPTGQFDNLPTGTLDVAALRHDDLNLGVMPGVFTQALHVVDCNYNSCQDRALVHEPCLGEG